MEGPRLAVSWLTVLPVRTGDVDAGSARTAIAVAPVVGALLGALAAGVAIGAHLLGVPPLLAGLLAVGVLALSTRGMHLDGLADTVDGLGCYGPPERALRVMRDGGAGPFAVAALVLSMGAQAASIGALAAAGRWGPILLACACGRAAFGWCCRRGYPAAREDGMGALVAGSQPRAAPVLWAAVLAVAGWFAAPWIGPLAVVLAAALLGASTWHVRRRLGGITGDVLGAACELTTTVVLVICTVPPP
ncbi:MAG: adenosylcobinamide-GDP ribazoletransferase [Sciscionella sp.]